MLAKDLDMADPQLASLQVTTLDILIGRAELACGRYLSLAEAHGLPPPMAAKRRQRYLQMKGVLADLREQRAAAKQAS
jgi:hypothetical protein